MRLAFCHNLKTSNSIEEAEYDTQDTVDRIAAALESGGHEVLPVNVGGELSRVAADRVDSRPGASCYRKIRSTAVPRGNVAPAWISVPSTDADTKTPVVVPSRLLTV